MAGKKQLAPVEVVVPDFEMSLSEAITSGTRLDELRAQRRILATRIDDPEALTRDIPPMIRQLREISKEIEALAALEADKVSQGSPSCSGSDVRSEAWKLEAI